MRGQTAAKVWKVDTLRGSGMCDLQPGLILSERMRWLLVVPALLFMCLAHGQDQRTLDFVNELLLDRIAEDTIWLSDEPSMMQIFDDTAMIRESRLFDEADWRQIQAQLKQAGRIRWKKGDLARVHLIRSRKLRALYRKGDGWTKFHERYAPCLPTISVPLFSKDGKRCIQWFGVWCGGPTGRGAVQVFEWKDGEWRLLQSFSQIVS